MVVVYQDGMFVAVFHEDFQGGCVPRFGQGTASDVNVAIARAAVAYGLAEQPDNDLQLQSLPS